MSTYFPKEGDIARKWFVVDATGLPLGRLAVARLARRPPDGTEARGLTWFRLRHTGPMVVRA